MKAFFIKLNTVFLLLALVALSGCESTGGTRESQPAPPAEVPVFVPGTQQSGDYKIGVDDIVRVSVWKNDDLSVQVPVRPDGKISVPLIGDVEVGGRTPTQVATSITTRLSTYLRDPQVTVILADLRSHEFLSRVRITGAVETPTSIPYRQGMTVLDAVLEAGGITKFASPDATKLYRKARQDADGEVKPVKLKRILKKGDLRTNYSLAPGDVITVPERFF